MWTAQSRGRYDRSQLRYPSDLTNDERARVESLIPPAKRGGLGGHVCFCSPPARRDLSIGIDRLHLKTISPENQRNYISTRRTSLGVSLSTRNVAAS
jgi:hypothetical protein